MSHQLHDHPARRSSPLYTSARYVFHSPSIFAASWLSPCSSTQSRQNRASRMFSSQGRYRCLIPPRLPRWFQHFVFPHRRRLHRLRRPNSRPHLPHPSVVQHPFPTALERRSVRGPPCGPGMGDGSHFHSRRQPRCYGCSSLAS